MTESNLATKRNEVMSHAAPCTEKEANHKRPCVIRFCLYEMFKIGKPMEIESGPVVA